MAACSAGGHREQKYVIGQAPDYVVAPHVRDQVESVITNEELERADAGRVFHIRRKADVRIVDVQDGPPRLRIRSKDGNEALPLTRPSPATAEDAMTVAAAANARGIVSKLRPPFEVVADKAEIV